MAPLDIDSVAPEVTVHYTVRHRGRRRVVELALVNGQRAVGETPDTARLYQVGPDRDRAGRARGDLHRAQRPGARRLPPAATTSGCTWRCCTGDQRQYAHGRQCAVDAAVRDGETGRGGWRRRASRRRRCRWSCRARCRGWCWTWRGWARPELGRDDLVRALRPLVTGYREWLDAQQARLARTRRSRGTRPPGEQALERRARWRTRLDRAIELLRDDGIAREAFRFANQAMALQRVRSEVVRARLADAGTRT